VLKDRPAFLVSGGFDELIVRDDFAGPWCSHMKPKEGGMSILQNSE
jgi:hypothetical protein